MKRSIFYGRYKSAVLLDGTKPGKKSMMVMLGSIVREGTPQVLEAFLGREWTDRSRAE